jgi:thiamine kinase-like enzyme
MSFYKYFQSHFNLPIIFTSVLHSMSLCHTDLKPENMLFVDSSYDLLYNEKMVGNLWGKHYAELQQSGKKAH